MEASGNVRRTSIAVTLAACCLALGSLPAPSSAVTSEGSTRSPGAATFDPHAFATAAEMYRVAPVKPYDSTARALVQSVTSGLAAGAPIEGPRVWPRLVELNPYRKSPEVISAAQGWAARYAGRARGPLAIGPVNSEAYLEGNKLYRSGSFAGAAAKYRAILRRSPQRLDVRSNLALAEMHQGNDLPALVELVVTRTADDSYFPALVNLTVVYERLGQRDRARALAQKVQIARSDVPQAVFNAAWYSALYAETAEVDKLREFADLGLGAKYQQMLDIATSGTGPRSGLWGMYGGKREWWRWTVAVAVFALATLVMLGISEAHGRGAPFASRGRRAFLTFAAIGTLVTVLYWGIPHGGWWGLVGAYVLFFGGVASSAARQ